jgi:uncharacterized membrane protein
MKHASADTVAQVMIWMGVLLGLVVVGVVIVQRYRGRIAEKGATAGELLANFQEMRTRGEIDDGDYRKIRSVLGNQLHRDPKDGKDKG